MKSIRFNVLIYVTIISFTIICFAGVTLFCDRVASKNEAGFYIVLDETASERVIYPWYSQEIGVWYVFLPAQCDTIKVIGDNKQVAYFDNKAFQGIVAVDSDFLASQHNITVNAENNASQTVAVQFMKSENIPSLFIDTESGNMDFINEKKGNDECGKFEILSLVNDESISGSILSLAGRGNTSWSECEKKGYKFELSEKMSLLGLKSDNIWILTANARSNYLLNSIAFWLEEKMIMKYVTNAVFVDLYFNGQYYGNYILCERITTGEEGIQLRDLDIANYQNNPGERITSRNRYQNSDGTLKAYLWKREPKDISGGFLIERDVPEYYEDENCGIITSSGDHYVIHSPKKATVSEAEYLLEYMNDFYNAAASSDGYNEKGYYYAEYIDSEDFAKKYVLEEFLAFADAGRSSAYYYKDAGAVLKTGPGWDFEGAFKGNPNYLTKLNSTYYSTDLFEQMMQHEDFQQLVYHEYLYFLRPAIKELQQIQFSSLYNQIYKSVQMDIIRWEREDFEESCNEIAIWIKKRINFLDDHLNPDNNWITIRFKSDYTNDQYLYVKPGEVLSSEMAERMQVSQIIEWVDSNGLCVQYGKPLYQDIVLYGKTQSSTRSILNILLDNIKLVIPEIIFMGIFIVLAVIYIFNIKRGKKDVIRKHF